MKLILLRNKEYTTMIDELEIECPCCGEELPEPIEVEAGEHNYVEQCEFCSNDIEFNFESNGQFILSLQIHALE